MKTSSRRNGKIARLPEAIRHQVNQMLRDGTPYGAIIKWLTDNGHPGFIPMNLSRWVEGGYEDWLSEREREHAYRDRLQWAAEIEQENGVDAMLRAKLNLNALQLFDALSQVDTQRVADKISGRADKFCTIMNLNFKLAERMRVLQQEKRWKELRNQYAASPRGDSSPASVPGGDITPDHAQ